MQPAWAIIKMKNDIMRKIGSPRIPVKMRGLTPAILREPKNHG
jgi:hypothetical protein